MEKTLHRFEVKYFQVMDEQGKVDATLKPKLSDDELVKLYRLMVLTRRYDEKALKLQRQGRMGVFASCQGQEAAQVGSAYALRQEDWLVPSYREHGAWITRGLPIEKLYQAWTGDERCEAPPQGINVFTPSIPIGSQNLHAVGIAYAMKVRKEKAAVMVYFGDGATSEGETLEAMNFAGAWNCPVVFLCQNNQYAISTRNDKETRAESFAQKAIAFGFEGIQVDGNDILAVYKAASEAMEKARQGKGPTLIECMTYRMSDHTTSDDAKKYRPPEELEAWKKRDPIDRLKKYMESVKVWDAKKEEALQAEIMAQVEAAVEAMEKAEKPRPEEMFDYVFEKPTPLMQEHREYVMELRKK